MTEEHAAPTNKWIPLLVLLPVVAVVVVVFLGYEHAQHAEAIRGSFDVPATTRTVRIAGEVGNLSVVLGAPGKVSFDGRALRVAETEEVLAQALKAPFTLEHDAGASTPETLVLRITPVPEGLRPYSEKRRGGPDPRPPLLRQMDLDLRVPVDLGLELHGVECNVRVDTRQAPTSIELQRGQTLVMHTTAAVRIRNGGGPNIIEQHRGPLDVEVGGKVRASLAELTGPVRIVSREAEVGLHLPPHSSFAVDARSTRARVRNAFGLAGEKRGEKDFRLVGSVAGGTHRVEIVAEKGPITIDKHQ